MAKTLIKRTILTLLVGTVLGYLALVAVYALPTGRIRENVKNSLGQYEGMSSNPEWSVGYQYTLLDDYTDVTFILANAIFPGPSDDANPFLNAAIVPHHDYVGQNNDAYLELTDYDGESFQFNYVRYWHGYLVPLKPLLLLMSLNNVRILNFVFELIMMSLVLQLALKKTGDMRLGAALTAALIAINPVSCAMNFQYAAVMNVTLIALLAVLLCYDKIDITKDAPILFLIIGMTVVYVDFLTYPIVSFALPLLTYMILKKKELLSGTKKGILAVISYLVFWGVGYVGMWGMKWIVGTIISGGKENALLEGFEQVVYRSGHGEVHYGFIATVLENCRILFVKPVLLAAVIAIVAAVVIAIRNKKNIKINNAVVLPILFVGLIPFMWYFGAREHSMDHAYFTFRNLAGTIMAVVLAVSETIIPTKE
ncbi:hypothetical protein D6856_06525 [Butyrivibrio sp. XB500-5]|uniref:hypothetical protein n=1 Tax=Butyrivibrio sp. XB500-5 TaxID=2364880 RepID=UPI000EAA77D4|nr:hypothetical protein [Butyrivibrio sp. XB500-5]RKM60705.1 hypothetical protein D6856_06525 [Butyrivibrio sp. XB500-5]